MNTRQRLSSSFPELSYSLLEFNSRNICQHLTNWTSWNKRDKVWSSANSLFKWCFCSSRHGCCSSSFLYEHQRYYLSTSATIRSSSHCTKVWHRTYSIYDAPLSRSAGGCFALLQKSRRNFCVCKQERMLQINACVVSLDKRGGRTWRFIVRTSNELSLKY